MVGRLAFAVLLIGTHAYAQNVSDLPLAVTQKKAHCAKVRAAAVQVDPNTFQTLDGACRQDIHDALREDVGTLLSYQRCDLAERVALQEGALELAAQVKAYCVDGKGAMSRPSPPPPRPPTVAADAPPPQ